MLKMKFLILFLLTTIINCESVCGPLKNVLPPNVKDISTKDTAKIEINCASDETPSTRHHHINSKNDVKCNELDHLYYFTEFAAILVEEAGCSKKQLIANNKIAYSIIPLT